MRAAVVDKIGLSLSLFHWPDRIPKDQILVGFGLSTVKKDYFLGTDTKNNTLYQCLMLRDCIINRFAWLNMSYNSVALLTSWLKTYSEMMRGACCVLCNTLDSKLDWLRINSIRLGIWSKVLVKTITGALQLRSLFATNTCLHDLKPYKMSSPPLLSLNRSSPCCTYIKKCAFFCYDNLHLFTIDITFQYCFSVLNQCCWRQHGYNFQVPILCWVFFL